MGETKILGFKVFKREEKEHYVLWKEDPLLCYRDINDLYKYFLKKSSFLPLKVELKKTEYTLTKRDGTTESFKKISNISLQVGQTLNGILLYKNKWFVFFNEDEKINLDVLPYASIDHLNNFLAGLPIYNQEKEEWITKNKTGTEINIYSDIAYYVKKTLFYTPGMDEVELVMADLKRSHDSYFNSKSPNKNLVLREPNYDKIRDSQLCRLAKQYHDHIQHMYLCYDHNDNSGK
jgi:hypothetical protein